MPQCPFLPGWRIPWQTLVQAWRIFLDSFRSFDFFNLFFLVEAKGLSLSQLSTLATRREQSLGSCWNFSEAGPVDHEQFSSLGNFMSSFVSEKLMRTSVTPVSFVRLPCVHRRAMSLPGRTRGSLDFMVTATKPHWMVTWTSCSLQLHPQEPAPWWKVW